MPSTKKLLVGVLGLGLTVTGLSLALPAAPAQAVGGVFISEFHYDDSTAAGDVNEFVEVTAPAGTDLSTYSVVLYNGGGTPVGQSYDTDALSGIVANQQDGWGTGVIDYPTNGIQNGSPDGIALVNSGTVVEFLSYEGGMTASNGPASGMQATDVGVSETNSTPPGSSIQRQVNGSWATTDAHSKGTPNGFDTGEPGALAATAEPDVETTVDEPMTPVVLEATGGTPPYEWTTTSTLPAGVTLSTAGELSGTPTETGTFPITATVTDDVDATDDVSFTLTVNEPTPSLTIAEIQGTDTSTSPEVGNEVRTEGVVTAMYKDPAFANSNIDGMYIQTGGTGGGSDGTPGASDAVFVWWSSNVAAVDGVAIGDSVEVTGTVSEFSGTTQIAVGLGDVVELGAPLDPVTPLAIAYPTTDAAREAQEGMLLAPTDDFTVSNTFNTNRFGEVGLATGGTPLVQPTDVADDDDAAALQAVKDDNFARGVILDDGTSLDYVNNNATKGSPLPWLTAAGGGPNPIRVGAGATLTGPVVLDFEFGAWRFYPQQPLFGNGDAVATFEDTRAANLAPAVVPGDLKLATFNVLNYFNTTGEAYVANGAGLTPPTHCTYFTDRVGDRIANNRCGRQNPAGSSQPNDGSGPRGAATDVSLARQQQKIVTAINGLGADVVTLEELENSIKLPGETDRDDAISALVDALNADAGAGTWAFVPSPAEASQPGRVAEQDTIRNGFIYKPASVELVGQSDLLFGTTAFANAREPLAQAFKPTGAGDDMAFAVIVNHFKSKGDSDPAATGDNANNPDTGAFNGDRVRQAQALVSFANEFAALRGTDKIFLTGDFNSYTHEDPITVLNDAGFDIVESDDANDESYSFGGLSGSLDHVLANEAALATVQGADIWEINADESVAFQYSRFNYNVTDFWQPGLPFAASDHNPEIVGFNPAASGDVSTAVQILGTNDFHGRLLADGAQTTQDCDDVTCPAAVLSAAVKQLRSENANTVFSAAGDLIGASTFESFILDDEPTIDALNEAGLEVSAAGNHEFDQGYEDLVGRVQDRANWEYIAANVDEPEGRDDLAETWTQTFGDVEVGFVGAVTEELPALVSPAGIEGVTVTDIVDATNAAAADLKAGGADIVVLLVHEGSPSTDCASPNFTDSATVWGNISQNTSDDVDAIISGHTHLAYNCTIDGRPVVSAGQYGQNLNQLMFLVDGTSGDVTLSSQSLLPLTEANWGEDPAVVDIVHAAKAEADILGAEVLGEIEAPANRAKLSNGTTENRGGESTLGNLVAEVQQWATEDSHDAQIAFMNPGGLRADMPGNPIGDAREVTYRQAAVVQPFANTLVNMDLTGAQIETVLEQQWQRDSGGNVPSRPFLRLGVSEGFTYTYVETPVTVNGTATFQGEVTGMWLDGVAIDPATTYSVTVNSFLASGGDNFRELANGTGRADTGKVDLAAMVDYLDTFASTDPLALNYSQRAVEVHDVADSYVAGEQVQFEVESWSMSTSDDVKDTEIQVELGDTVLGTATLDNAVSDAVLDRTGTASVDVALPASTPAGPATLTLVGAETGTEVTVPITVEAGATTDVQILGTNDFHGRLLPDGLPTTSDCNTAGVGCPAALLSGAVKELRGENPNTVFAAAGDLIGASTFESFIQQDEPTIEALNEATLDVSAAGNHEFDQGYEDLVGRVQDLADWEYIAANVDEPEGRDDLAETWTQEFGDVKVGFVGAVTEELPSLVSPAGIAGVTVTDIVDATNAAAADLKSDGADMVVLLVHEGSPSTSCASPNFTDPATVWGNITQNTSADVDAIISGHTHLAYNCSFPVDEWVTDGRAVTERPVVSSGQYGQNLNQLLFTVDTATGDVMAKTQNILALTEANFTEDPAVVDIVHAAKAEADILGAAVLGQVEAPLNRAKLANGTTENRGGESTLGNLVAEVQRWATEAPEQGAAQIAFMNPGGLRQDMAGTVNGDARDVTYRQAAVVQPFANTLVNMDLTGAQIETVLEQQWQRDSGGNVPSRPFLRLGVSKGFTYTYVETPVTVNGTATFQGEVTGMWLDGVAIDPATTYSVTVNSFLASGGDNFRELANGTGRADTGKVDLQAMVDYLDEFAPVGDPLEIDYSQRAVEVHNVADSYVLGASVEFDVESWTMSTADDVKDSEIVVKLGDTELGTATLDNTIGTEVYDFYGTAHVDVPLPAGTPAGDAELTLVGENTGTEILVPITVAKATATVTGTDVTKKYASSGMMQVTVVAPGLTPTGNVTLTSGGTTLGSALLANGSATVTIPARSLPKGTHTVTIAYTGDGSVQPGTGTATVTVVNGPPR